MSDKIYLSANELMRDSFRLGQLVLDSGWRPDVLIALWRGGTPVGVAVHELLLYHDIPTIHMAVKCQSYSGIGQRGEVVFENTAAIFAQIRPDHRVLVVDDIFDSGCTARAALRLLAPRCVEVRLATLYWKPNANVTDLRPHYHVRETDAWIVFPHELEGLTAAEVRQKDPALHEMLFGMKTNTSRDWQPLLLDRISIDTLRAPAYRRFIFDAAIAPGCRLLLARHRRRPDWPFVETKFNPNTGRDLPAESYHVVFAWFLGRGSEALDDHLRGLDRIESLMPEERDAVRRLFTAWIANMTQAMSQIADKHLGRIPFRVNRDLQAIDAAGRPTQPDSTRVGAGDIFGIKGLLSSADPAMHQRAFVLLQRAAELIRRDRDEVEQTAPPPGRGHGMRMLMQGVGSCFARKALDPAMGLAALDLAAVFLEEVLTDHYDPHTAIFSEYVDRTSGARAPLLDPGHANELAGLGLGMIEHLERSPLAERHAALIVRARRDLPLLLLKSTALGYNARHPGMYKTVNNRTGEPVNSDMPWWNLPETMRAAVRAYAVADSESIRIQCLEAFRLCHNAYFSHYPNRDNLLFPFQTLDGKTGKILDVVPAVPEGDPLYHANGAFLDMLEVIERL